MNLQDKIKERYSLIQEKGAFLKACALKDGFSNSYNWVKTYTPENKQKEFLEMIELQLKYDKRVMELKVEGYKILSQTK